MAKNDAVILILHPERPRKVQILKFRHHVHISEFFNKNEKMVRFVSAAMPRTAAQPAKLDSDKFGDEAARPNRWLD